MQSQAQVRVVDPILSRHARGYRQQQLVGSALFPLAYVAAYGGKVIEFDKSAFRAYNTQRAPGTKTKRIQFGYAGRDYSISSHSLEGYVADEHRRDGIAVPGIDLAARAVNTPMRALLLEHEVRCAALALNASNYDSDHKVALAGGDRWTGSSSTPNADIEAGKEAIRASIGVYPNVALVSAKAMSALRFNPQILDRLKYTGRDTPTAEILSAMWGIERVVVGAAVAAAEADDAFGDVWGDDVVLGYAAQGNGDLGVLNAEEPSCGYTYAIEGMPMVEEPYRDNGAKSWIYPVTFDNTPVLSGMTAMYLIQDAGGAAA